MSMTDTIADMLTRIRNAQKSKLMSVRFSYSKMKYAILGVLKEEGYIVEYKILDGSIFSEIEVDLKYSLQGKPAICQIDRVSRPGKRIYSSIVALKGYYNNMGVYVLSTSKGVLSDRAAKQFGVGGEVICKVF